MVNTKKVKKLENNRDMPNSQSLKKQKENQNPVNSQVSGSSMAAASSVSNIPLPPDPKRNGSGSDQSRYHTFAGSAQTSSGRNFSEEFPAYLVIEAVNTEVNLNELSMVKRSRELITFCGEPRKVSRSSKKAMQIACVDGLQSKKLLTMKTFAGHQVTVTPHRFLNESKGVVSHFELISCTEDEIREETSHLGVTYVKRLFKKVDGTFVPSSSVVLTFNTPHTPSNIKIGWVNLQIRPYIELPRRCRNCQRFGHGKNTCKQHQVCPRCSGPHNNDNLTCQNQPLCNNCGGPHGAYAPTCPKYKYEAEVLSVRSSQKLSFPDARALVEASGMFPAVSYAQRTQNGIQQNTARGPQAAHSSKWTKKKDNYGNAKKQSGDINPSKRPRESDDDGSPSQNTSRPSTKYRTNFNLNEGVTFDNTTRAVMNSNLIAISTASNSADKREQTSHENMIAKTPKGINRSRSLSRQRNNSKSSNHSTSSLQQ